LKNAVLICLAAAALSAGAEDQTAREILALERQAMDGWRNGDPDPSLAIADPDITYFHAVIQKRLEGREPLKQLYEGYRGVPLFDSYEIDAPKVQAGGDIAVLTYQLVWRKGDASQRWNATEVYQRKSAGWRVIHSHFSQARSQP
jgi:hypothetical protein